ncbi:hypothetical protein TELCIR_03801 [Teladorsagia circumcincta]|uniref:Uncharacterized protein n=1 Tax=Teladorsagia circumcincta TaxID=45464 RepID=A0A2G9UVC8_TELCI|nr:hypothetical protein TELCIR_03801 [Teladorsagia circumcincta]
MNRTFLSTARANLAATATVVPSGYRSKRANEYGDEAVTPPPADGNYAPQEEQTPEPANQGYGGDDGANVEPAGYRKKRANEYGDESITPPPPSPPPGGDYGGPPPPPGGGSYGEETPAPVDQGYYGGGSYGEETPAPVDQGYYGSDAPPVEPAGYRRKRANEYGDESITPPPYPPAGGPDTPRPPPGNEYGDEPITLPPPPGGNDSYGGLPTAGPDPYGSIGEETPVPVDQGYPAVSDSPPVEPAGY